MNDKAKTMASYNVKSPCPACRRCTKEHCGGRRCEAFLDWFSESWEEIQMKWGRDL